ncbi:MAG: hypothetical protein L6W00_18580 [Lentisphaeria bacterium]|nr:MAG: hypothetical protein L6W00_18580 [Lentisphaeria bacterium]
MRTRRPASRGLVMDGYREYTAEDTGTNPNAGIDYNSVTRIENLKAWRHRKCINVAYFDSHVEPVPYLNLPTATGESRGRRPVLLLGGRRKRKTPVTEHSKGK